MRPSSQLLCPPLGVLPWGLLKSKLGCSRHSLGPKGAGFPFSRLPIFLEFSTAAASAPRHPSRSKIPGSLRLPFPNHTSFPTPGPLRPGPQSCTTNAPHPWLIPGVPSKETPRCRQTTHSQAKGPGEKGQPEGGLVPRPLWGRSEGRGLPHIPHIRQGEQPRAGIGGFK